MIGQWLRARKERREKARALYFAAATQARNPVFYRDMGVPDTIDGRFEMTALHVFMVMKTLKDQGGRPGKALSQALFDRMFRVTDQAIREMGIGDLSVPRHMKRMMTAFNGRAYSYELALRGGQDLRDALRRNVFGTVDGADEGAATALETYVRESLATLTFDSLLQDQVRFAPLPQEEGERRYG